MNFLKIKFVIFPTINEIGTYTIIEEIKLIVMLN